MQRLIFRLLATTLFLSAVSIFGFAQDAGQVLRLSVSFRTVKNTLQMNDEKRKVIADLESQARTATNQQKFSEAYRHYSHGIALMRGQTWTPAQALTAALQVKAERLILDPGDRATLTLTQFFALDEPIAGKLSGSLEIKNSKQGLTKELKSLSDIEPNFVKPVTIDATIPELADGEYQLALGFKSKEGDSVLKSISIRV